MARYRLKKGTHSAFVGGERIEYVAGRKGHDIMELSEEQAKLPHFRRRVERIQDFALDFTPDEDNAPAPVLHILSGNVDDVLRYIEKNEDNQEVLEELRKAESGGKRRKTVLDKLDELLGE